jgi:hypothetical protein
MKRTNGRGNADDSSLGEEKQNSRDMAIAAGDRQNPDRRSAKLFHVQKRRGELCNDYLNVVPVSIETGKISHSIRNRATK